MEEPADLFKMSFFLNVVLKTRKIAEWPLQLRAYIVHGLPKLCLLHFSFQFASVPTSGDKTSKKESIPESDDAGHFLNLNTSEHGP